MTDPAPPDPIPIDLVPIDLVPIDLVYDELRRLARRYLARERSDHTFQPTDLVHEACAKVADRSAGAIRDPVHYKAIAARAMREILVDHARAKLTEKRGAGAVRVTLQDEIAGRGAGTADAAVDVVALDDALCKLAAADPRKARMIELRFFGGLSIEETARVLEVSHMTVSSDWRIARAWLAAELGSG